jgi:hypothetical protein
MIAKNLSKLTVMLLKQEDESSEKLVILKPCSATGGKF